MGTPWVRQPFDQKSKEIQAREAALRARETELLTVSAHVMCPRERLRQGLPHVCLCVFLCVKQACVCVCACVRVRVRVRVFCLARPQLQKNFPPCYPIARNHIAAEVPEKYRFTVRLGFITYLGVCVVVRLVFACVAHLETSSFWVACYLPLKPWVVILDAPFMASLSQCP